MFFFNWLSTFFETLLHFPKHLKQSHHFILAQQSISCCCFVAYVTEVVVKASPTYFHILNHILFGTCTSVFEKLTFSVKDKQK